MVYIKLFDHRWYLQFGYRPLNYTPRQAKSRDALVNTYTDVLIAYIDFAKAFDVVLRDKLLQKLVAYGITSDLLR